MSGQPHSPRKDAIITLCGRAIAFFYLGGLNVHLAILVMREIITEIEKEYTMVRAPIPEDIIESVASVNAAARHRGQILRITL
jgi:hypothetical protein